MGFDLGLPGSDRLSVDCSGVGRMKSRDRKKVKSQQKDFSLMVSLCMTSQATKLLLR